VQKLLDDFASLLDIRVTFFSVDGIRLKRGKEMSNCKYCSLVQEKLGLLETCNVTDCEKRLQAAKDGGVVSYICHAGLGEGIAPVTIQGKVAGFLMIGQYRVANKGKTDEFISSLSEEDANEFKTALEELPEFTPEKLASILGLFKTLIDYIVVRELAVIQEDHLKVAIDRYIKKHGDISIRLPQMAKHLGHSVSSISSFLRINYHTCFKDLVTEHRLKLAIKHWKQNPDATVAETARAAGFTDQFYFSRMFKKYYQIPPGNYRDSIRNSYRPKGRQIENNTEDNHV
jgi:AraC-like DNA-binding protein